MKGTAPKPTLFVLGVLVSVLILGLVGFGFGWLLSGRQIANLKEGAGSPPAMTTPTTTPNDTSPKTDVPGKDFSDLPRYPGSVRVEYQRHISETGLLLVETEYFSPAELDDAREFYHGVFQSEGWAVADFNVSEDEWDFFVVRGKREAIIEIEPMGELLEIEIEVSEPRKDREARNARAAPPQRSEQTAPPRTPPSDEDYDFGDDYDANFDEDFEGD